MRKKSGQRLLLVQVARAVGIILVLIGHINIQFYERFTYDWFNMGVWDRTGGVDFFFVVTGFMIYYVYHHYIGTPGKASEFLVKRVIKIYPIYWVFTLLVLAGAFLFRGTENFYTIEVIVKSMLLLPIDPAVAPPVLSAAWSLNHIGFFYVLAAFIIYKPCIFIPIVACWGILTFFISLQEVFGRDWGNFVLSFSNLEIFAGCFIAYVYLNYNLRYAPFYIITGIGGFIGIWINNIYGFIPMYEAQFHCLFSMMLILGLALNEKKQKSIPAALSFQGDASYSVFITHMPFLQLYIFLFAESSLIQGLGYFWSMVTIIVITVLSGNLVYLWVEKPMTTYLKSRLYHRVKIPAIKSARSLKQPGDVKS
ncbi:acyltransferase family protein [Alteribacillus sp. HJP-4]|uniref:acyltransferase family protein n=1 Tax=Alteribacillus sp. HJP-4 TaxID=2775394 RepID=UPI0035CD1B4A